MEGVAGVVSWDQVTPGKSDYMHARGWMIEEANAAIAGAFDGGARHVLVNDSHNGMRNLLPHELDPRATLVSGGLKDYGMMAGLDDTFAAALFIGYHARGGGPGVLAHTWSSRVIGVRLNGQEVGEWGLNAMIAGAFGVPVVMVTGDDCLAKEVREGLPGPVETVVVKRALTKYAAENLPGRRAGGDSGSAAQALRKVREIPLLPPAAPIALEVDLNATQLADSAAMMPKAERRALDGTVHGGRRPGSVSVPSLPSWLWRRTRIDTYRHGCERKARRGCLLLTAARPAGRFGAHRAPVRSRGPAETRRARSRGESARRLPGALRRSSTDFARPRHGSGGPCSTRW